jgi:hypothetical protein
MVLEIKIYHSGLFGNIPSGRLYLASSLSEFRGSSHGHLTRKTSARSLIDVAKRESPAIDLE